MPATCEAPMTGLFDQAVQSFGDALRAGVKAQEQIAGFWSEALSRTSAADYQKKTRGFLTDTVPIVQKTSEDYLRLVDANYRKSVEALKRACDGTPGNTPAEFHAKAQSLFDAAVDLVKENAQALTQTNMRVLEVWADALRHNGAPVTTGPGPTVKPSVK